MEDRICVTCGRIIEDGEDYYWTEEGWVCEDCRDFEYVTCIECGEHIKLGDAVETYDSDYICQECRDRYYITCEQCGAIVRETESREVHTRSWGTSTELICPNCFDDGDYRECDDCGEYFKDDYMTYTVNGYVCDNCRDDNYECCACCGDWYPSDDMIWDDYNGSYYCQDCYGDMNRRDPRIRDYHDNPDVRFYGENTFGRQHHIGFELEIDRRDRDRSAERDLLDVLENIAGNRLYFMNDGSLDYGFEIISQPHTMNELLYHLHIEDILRACADYGYLSHTIGTCGLHFHLSRQMFGPEGYRDMAIQKMMLFYDTYYDEIIKFARRTPGQLHWCKSLSDTGENNMLSLKERAKKYKDLDKSYKSHDDRYKVVNTTNKDTVEIRIMRGTLKLETFLASLDFVYTVARNARTISWKQSVDAKYWLKGLNAKTIEYMTSRDSFMNYIQ